MKLKDLKDNYKMIDRLQLKVSKWWLFKAWLFGKRTQGTDCVNGKCLTLYAVVYKGKVYCYKEKKFKESEIGPYTKAMAKFSNLPRHNMKTSKYFPMELYNGEDEIDPKAIEFLTNRLRKRPEGKKIIITTNPETRGYTFDGFWIDEETKKGGEE